MPAGSCDRIPQRHARAQPAVLPLRPGRREHLVHEELHHRVRLGLLCLGLDLRGVGLRSLGPPRRVDRFVFRCLASCRARFVPLGRFASARPHWRVPTTPATSSASSTRLAGDDLRDGARCDELAEPIRRARRAGQHRLARSGSAARPGEAVGRLVAAGAVLLQRLHHDPVELAAAPASSSCAARSGGRRPSDGSVSAELSRVLGRGGSSSRMIRRISSQAASLNRSLLQRRRAGQQFVEQHAERIDVRAGVHVEVVELRLLRGHVQRRAEHRLVGGVRASARSATGASPWPGRSR